MTSILHEVRSSVTSEAFSPHLVQVSALLSSLWLQMSFQTHSTMAPQAPWTYYLRWLAASTLLKAIVTQQKVIWKSSECIIIVLTAGTTMFVSLLKFDLNSRRRFKCTLACCVIPFKHPDWLVSILCCHISHKPSILFPIGSQAVHCVCSILRLVREQVSTPALRWGNCIFVKAVWLH